MRICDGKQILAVLLMLVLASAGAPAQTTRSSPIALQDLAGMTRYPLEIGEASAIVIIFTGIDCPISNAYAPLINQLCEQYKSKKVAFYLVHCDADLSIEAAAKHAKEFGYACPVLMDPRRQLARRLEVHVTPEAAVIDRSGKLAYRGRIDDAYITLGRRRYQATTHDLRDAIEAVLAGRDVTAPRTRAVGCAINE